MKNTIHAVLSFLDNISLKYILLCGDNELPLLCGAVAPIESGIQGTVTLSTFVPFGCPYPTGLFTKPLTVLPGHLSGTYHKNVPH